MSLFWGFASLLLKDVNLLDCDFGEHVLSLILDNDYVLVNDIVIVAKVVPKNVGRSSRVQDSAKKFLGNSNYMYKQVPPRDMRDER